MAQVLRSDASALAAGCRADAQALARRLVKLNGRRDAAERREVRGELRRLAKEEKRRQSAAATEVRPVLDNPAGLFYLISEKQSQLIHNTFI